MLASLAVGIAAILVLGAVLMHQYGWVESHPALIFVFGSAFLLIESLVLGNCWACYADSESAASFLFDVVEDDQEKFYEQHRYPGS